MNKEGKFNGGSSSRKNNKAIDKQAIKDSVKWSITEYSIFVSKLVKKGLSLNTNEKLSRDWFSGIYVNDQGELNFTDPFTMKNKPAKYNNNSIIGAVGSFDLDDSKEYYIIPETNKKFVEVLDNKGEIDPDFPLKNYSLHLSRYSSSDSKHADKVSIRKYDDAVSRFIKNEIQKGSFLDLFEIYIEEKIKILNKLK